MASAVLEVEALSKSFGGVRAIQGLSFSLHHSEVLGLIGPNGSGKSTTVNVLAGVHPATSGSVVIDGAALDGANEPGRVAAGLARTFQTASVFPEFTVAEHVALGAEVTRRSRPAASVFRLPTVRREEEELGTQVAEILALTGLQDVADHMVGTISSAQQRFLMIATALASAPKVLLLDEPAAGMIAPERAILRDLIRRIRERGVAVLVIEHHMALIMEVCDRIVVLNFGEKIAEGTPAEIREDQRVIDAYLGESV